MNKILAVMIVVGAVALSLAASPAAFAKGAVPAQNHHCQMPDGSMDMAKTHKQCTAAKGKWAKDKDAPATTATPAPAPAAAPAPAPAK